LNEGGGGGSQEFCNKIFKIIEFDSHERRCAGLNQMHQKEVDNMILMEK